MVNHYTLDNEQLVKRLIEVIEESVHIYTDENDEYTGHKCKYHRNKEYHEIMEELLERLK